MKYIETHDKNPTRINFGIIFFCGKIVILLRNMHVFLSLTWVAEYQYFIPSQDSDMSNNTNTVVYFDWKDGKLFISTFADNVAHNLCCPIQADDNSSTCTFTTGQSVTCTFVTIILCLHVLIARRILLILDMLIIFSEYKCH